MEVIKKSVIFVYIKITIKKMTTQDFKSGQQVEMRTDNGIIIGTVSFNHTGRQTNLVKIEFIYNNQKYKMPFSRKTGKLYAIKLPFNIKIK